MGICDMRLNHVLSLVVWEYGVGESRVGKVGSVVSIESVVVVVRLKVETDDSNACLIYDRPRKEREFENEFGTSLHDIKVIIKADFLHNMHKMKQTKLI